MSEYKCLACNDTGMRFMYVYGETLGVRWYPCKCPVAVRQQQRLVELQQMGQQLRADCNRLNAQAAEELRMANK